MKWIVVIFGVGIIRGVVFPDYRFGPNIVIIPFLTPVILAFMAAYMAEAKRLSWPIASVSGLASVYLSTLIGVVVYRYSVGWNYVTEDMESQAVFMATLGIQTITFFIVIGASIIVAKRYNKRMQTDAAEPRR